MKNQIKSLIKNHKKWIINFICIIIFVVILENVFDNEIVHFDMMIFNIVKKSQSNHITNLFKIITSLGSATVLIIITLLLLMILKNKKMGIMIAINLLIIGMLNQILKYMVQRPRPIENRLIQESGYSFPSGHSMASVAFYGLIIYFIFKNVKNKILRNICCVFLSVLVLLIGISRIYLGVHYASDVLAGFVISIAYLIVFVSFIQIGEKIKI